MAKRMIDIKLTSVTGGEDVVVANEDFQLDESTTAHQQQIILNNKGDFKQNPAICVGAFEYFDDENFQGLVRATNVEFSKDGMDVKSIKLTAGRIIRSDAFYS